MKDTCHHDGNREKSLLKSLEKSLDVLDLFVECNAGMALKEIAAQTELNTSTAFRIVNTLERRQYLTRNEESKQYRLGPKSLALGYSSHWTENLLLWPNRICANSNGNLMKRQVFILLKEIIVFVLIMSKAHILYGGLSLSESPCLFIKAQPVRFSLLGLMKKNKNVSVRNTAILQRASFP